MDDGLKIKTENIIAKAGIPFELILLNIDKACPCKDKLFNILPVLNIPLLQDESAAVITTMGYHMYLFHSMDKLT